MDVLGKFPAHCAAGALILLMAGCSSAPTKTESAPPKSVYNTPKTTIQPAPNQAPVPVVASTTPAKVTAPAKVAAPTKATTPATPPPKPQSATKPPSSASAVTQPVPAKTPTKPAPVQPVAKPAPVKTPLPVSKPDTQSASTVALLDATQSPKPAAETLKVTLNNLPLNIRGEWVLDRNESRCMLKSAPLRIDDGQGGTSVTLLIEPGIFLVKTGSDIDLTYKNTGLQIDGKSPFALETVDARTNVSFIRQRQAILDNMQSGHELRVTLGFWPTWPVTQPYSVAIPLTHFATAMKAWDTCNQLLSRK